MEWILCPSCGTSIQTDLAPRGETPEDQQAIKQLIDTANRHYNEALALARAGNLDEALGQAEAAIALAGRNPNYHLLLGSIHAQRGRYEAAIQAWERVLSLSPDMENAYNNIDKAQRLMDETQEEQRKRPFLLTAIGAGTAALFLLLTTAFFGVQSFYKSGKIRDLTVQLENLATQSNNWKQQFETLSQNFPTEGIAGLTGQAENWKKIAGEREKTIAQLQTRHKLDLDKRNLEIQQLTQANTNLQNEANDLRQKVAQINPLNAVIATKNQTIRSLQQQIEKQKEEIQAALAETAQIKDQLAKALAEVQKTRDETHQTLAANRAGADQTLESMRAETQTLRDELAAKDRQILDRQYADSLTVKAAESLRQGEFDAAGELIRKALERSAGHEVALYYKNQIQKILADPIEQEVLRREARNRDALRRQVLGTLAQDNLKEAKSLLDQGRFDQAIALGNRTLTAVPEGSKEAAAFQDLIQQAEQRREYITLLILDAKKYIAARNFKQAETILKRVLKESPSSEEAQSLLQQISSR
ncbi:MAG: tetratricopeptide repeat protein [bacterium]